MGTYEKGGHLSAMLPKLLGLSPSLCHPMTSKLQELSSSFVLWRQIEFVEVACDNGQTYVRMTRLIGGC